MDTGYWRPLRKYRKRRSHHSSKRQPNRYFRGVIFKKLAPTATLENPSVDSSSFRRMNFAFPGFLKAASVLSSFERPRARYEHKLAL
jgi:hypothetical protein